MKKHTSLLALGIILSSQILPIAAHANSVESITGLSDGPPSSVVTDNDNDKNNQDTIAEVDVEESVEQNENDNTEQVIDELEDKEVTLTQEPRTLTEQQAVSSDKIIETTWGTAKAEFDTETGTLTLSDGVINTTGYFNEPEGLQRLDIKHIIFKNNVVFGTDVSNLFSGYTFLETISGDVDTSNSVNMSGLFASTSSLTMIDIKNWDTSNVTDMSSMFSGASSITSLDLNFLNTSNVTDMSGMFSHMTNLKILEISNFNTSNVINMFDMFSFCESLEHLDINSWDTSSVTSMLYMFRYTYSLSGLDVSNWNTSNVTQMYYMFYGARSLTKLDLSRWDLSSTDSIYNMFYEASSLKELNLSGWDTQGIYTQDLFGYTNSLEKITLGTSSVFSKDDNLPSIDTTTGEYTGRWINEETGETYESSDVFMRDYDGSKPGTYVWEKKLQSINAKDTTIYVGDAWNPESSFVSATNSQGSPVTFDKITVEGTVDTSKVGTYPIVYTYDGQSTTVNVNVIERKESLVTKDSTVKVGTKWEAKDNFVSATDQDGNPLDISDITVEGSVDTSKVGTYPIVYTCGGQSKTAHVNVVEAKESLATKDSTIKVGTKWEAKDNFVSATDQDGNPLDISAITVEGTVDTKKAGQYKVLYTWYEKDETGEQTGLKVSSEATITVVEQGNGKETDDNKTNMKNNSNSSTKLPNTGEQSSVMTMTIGGLMLLFAGGMALFGLKKIKKETK